ncbi:MAG TPA: response regulator [Myxococcales bacterium]|jgi:CheY-like chemotaxis protein
MPKTALIIEDDESQAKALQALCEKLGLEASYCRNGKEGLEQALQKASDLVLLDMLVPGMDGFKVAEGLKAKGSKAQIVVVTGVYKDPKVAKEFHDKYGADFFQKPYKAADLSACIARRLGLASAAPAEKPTPQRRTTTDIPVVPRMEGELRDKSYPTLLLELARAKATGTLELTQGQAKKRLFLFCGQVRFAQSNVKAENVGGMQVAEGTLSEDRFKAAVMKARDERIGIGEALALAGDLSYDALAKAARRQVEEVSVSAFAWADAHYVFAPGPTDKIQDARQDPLLLLLAAYKRYVDAEKAKAQLAGAEKGTLSRGPDFDRALFGLRGVFPGETVTPMINGRLTVGDVLAKARPNDLPLLAALVGMGLATVTGAEAYKKAAAVKTAGPNRPYTPEEEAARANIRPEYERVMAAVNLFSVLRLPQNASIEEVKAAYLQLAKRFHADSFAGLELGEVGDMLGELFGKISEAHSILGDPKRRADYLILLERQEAGLPTDMEVIFKADGAFNRGDALMKQGRFADAEQAFKEALKLDASVAQYHVALAQAVLKGRGASGVAEARDALEKALGLNPEHTGAKLVKASVLEADGDFKGAAKLLEELYATDPSNHAVEREYRAVKQRWKESKNQGSGGLLGKLFSKKL